MPTEKLPTYRETTAGSKCQCYCTGPRDQSCYCGWWVFFLIVDFSIGTCDFCARKCAPSAGYLILTTPTPLSIRLVQWAAFMLMFVSFNQVYGSMMSLLSGAILTSAISSFFLGIAMLAFAVLILVSRPPLLDGDAH